jgi:hypothetical protein
MPFVERTGAVLLSPASIENNSDLINSNVREGENTYGRILPLSP